MNNLLFSLFFILVGLFRHRIYPLIRKGQVKEGFCGLWFINSIFSLGGMVLSFYLYQYTLLPLLSLRNLFFLLAYVAVGGLIVLLAPSGHGLFTKKNTPSEEEMLLYEYRFHETADLACRFFQFLLFGIPVLFALLEEFRAYLPQPLCLLADFATSHKLYGGFCFFAFLILLPLSLRQTIYWLKSLKAPTTKDELTLQHIYSARLRYKQRNRIL